jgi:hypothetical protein
LANKYDHDIKSFACRAKIEEEANDELKAQLAKLTSEHMALQADHKGLECSYEKLVDSYATLEIAHEVVLSLEKSKMQPSQDNREDMVKKLERGSTVTSSIPQQHTMTHKNKIKKRASLGKSSPNIARPSTRHKITLQEA